MTDEDPDGPPARPFRIVHRTDTPGTPPVVEPDPTGPGLTLRRRTYPKPQPVPHARVDRTTDDGER